MCGIAALILKTRDEKFDSRLRAMVKMLAHRGPDASGVHVTVASQEGLGHTRLSILDLEKGKQPFRDPISGMTLVYNGEIYNYRDIRKKLIAQGMSFSTDCDTEVVLKAFVAYGPKCLDLFVGMFAFIVHLPDGSYFFARDRFGIKPLCFAQSPQGLVAASEMKAIFATDLVAAMLDPGNLMMNLSYGYSIDASTTWQGVQSVQPGEYMWYRDQKLTKTKYYDVRSIPFGSCTKTNQGRIEELTEKLSESVRIHLTSNVPVVASLSGGLDSSVVAALCSQQQSIDAYCVGYGQEDDESPFASQLAVSQSIPLHKGTINLHDSTRSLARILYHLEEPIPHIQVPTTYHGGQIVRDSLRSKVVLIGEGADEIFGGYDRHGFSGRRWTKFRGCNYAYREYGRFHHALLPDYDLSHIFESQYCDGLDRFRAADEARRAYYSACTKDPLQMVLLCDLAEQLPNSQLVRVDKLFMASSVEARVPFLDHRLVELAWSLPAKCKVGSVCKKILRDATREIIPDANRLRKKSGVGGTQNLFPSWFRHGLREILLSEVREGLWNRGIFRRAFLKDVIEARVPNYHKVLLCLGFLEIVLKTFHDRVLGEWPIISEEFSKAPIFSTAGSKDTVP
jgi:asparagine synthase (glutamine-hydrolysing)